VYTLVCHTRLKRKRRPGKERKEPIVRVLSSRPSTEQTARYLQCTYCSLSFLSLSFILSPFLPLSLFFNRARTRSFLLGHIPSLSVCSVVCTLPPPRSSHVSVLPRNTSSCIFSPIYQISECTKYSKTIVREFFETDCSLK